jgi:AraC-like DNA-binding protein
MSRPAPGFHLLMYTFRGRARLLLPAGEARFDEGQMWLLPAGHPHRYVLEEDYWEIMWFHLADVEPWSAIGGSAARRVHPDNPGRMRALMLGIIEESLAARPDAASITRPLCAALFVCLQRCARVARDPRAERVRGELARLWERVDANLSRRWRVEQLAAALGVSAAHLHRLTASHHGTTPMGVVTALRMRRAEELLLSTDYKLDLIADLVGYGTAFALSKAFKRHAGKSPREFRRGRARP